MDFSKDRNRKRNFPASPKGHIDAEILATSSFDQRYEGDDPRIPNGLPVPAEAEASTIAGRVAIATLGCKVNQCESAAMIETLRSTGYVMVPFGGQADYFIINTCAVTANSDYQSRQLVRRAIRHNPGAVIVVTGCYAQSAPEQIARIPGVTVVAGNGSKEEIARILGGARVDRQQIIVSDIRRARECTACQASFQGRTRAFLKIQDGCNARCSYCIVPYTRGRSRSLPAEQVKEQIIALGRAGYREVVLTGIHLGAYGRDLRPKSTLFDIVRWVEDTRHIDRLRLSSLEPNEVTDEFISLMKTSHILCRHFHIPLQSGNDRILKCMGRKYDAAFAMALLEKIHRVLPDAAIGLDVIVGFPGEGEGEFTSTLLFLEAAPAAYFHVFSYSIRPGTLAAQMSGHVEEKEKRKRSALLRKLGKSKREAFAERFVGEKLSVLVEEPRADGAFGKGFSGNYIPVLIKNGNASLGGRIITVLAEHAEEGRVTGAAING